MLLEASRSRRNEAILRARGAVEPPGDVYAWMQIAYPGCFVAIVVEAALRQQPAGAWAIAGAVIFLLAKALKYSAIAALGDRWTFRVLVLPRRSARHHGSLPVAAPSQLRRRRRRADRGGADGRQSRDRRYRFRRVRWDDAGAHPGRGTRAQYLNREPANREPANREFCER